MKSELTKSHQITYDAFFQHPIAHNIEWRNVRSMLAELGDVVDEENGNFKVTCEAETLALRPTKGKNVDNAETLMDIRRFLKRVNLEVPVRASSGTNLLVVIDHREARIYRTQITGDSPDEIAPYDPHGFGRALHYNQDDASGQRKPELKSFYEAVAKTLKGADKILVFGTGTGSSSAMQELLSILKTHHHDIFEHVVGSIVIDEHHLTSDQLLAKARELFV